MESERLRFKDDMLADIKLHIIAANSTTEGLRNLKRENFRLLEHPGDTTRRSYDSSDSSDYAQASRPLDPEERAKMEVVYEKEAMKLKWDLKGWQEGREIREKGV